MTLQLVISDLDGTIVETEDYHRRAYNGLFEELGFDTRWTKQDYVNRLNVMGGGKLKEVFSWINKPDSEYGKFKEETYLRKTQVYLQLITHDLRAGALGLRPGVQRLFAEIEKAGVPIAIGTACEKNAAYQVLDAAFHTSFTRKLEALCGGDDTPLKKPNPAIYLLVAEQCGVDPYNCVVLEDTHHGMMAALSAGMKCVASPSEYALSHDFSDATLQVKDFQTPSPLTLHDLRNLYEL